MHTTHRSSYRTRPTHTHRRRTRNSKAAHARRLSGLELFILVVCLAALATVFIASLGTRSTPDVDTAPIRVTQADTLWDLARTHPIEGLTTAETVEHIKRINELEASSVHAGDLLLVPACNTIQTAVAAR